ncbi:MAG: glycosyltransferase family 39 protein, partial [Bryobacterales bacterium]|nr:glycosyltransferase family 39 protein [Bryobacterales bacterium]
MAEHRQRGSGVLLVFVLAIQAVLLFVRLDLLPAWTDEAHTLEVAPLPPGEIARRVAADVHPPLYFWLAHGWLELPLPGSPLERLRALSGVLVLLTTLVVHRLWLSRMDARSSACFLVLWALSPCLLLYGRMARSYSLQVLVAVVAITVASAGLRRPPSLARALRLGAALAIVLYVHYVPGLALAGAVAIASCWRALREKNPRWLGAMAIANAFALLLYSPWLPALLGALSKWTGRSHPYRVFASPWLDEIAKIGYGFFSFSFGETPGTAGLVSGAVRAPPLAGVAIGEAAGRARPGGAPLAASLIGLAVHAVSR